ncbi:MAG: DUF2177 family protein [Desulfobacterales bacterium]|jgi:uncharacterized membrane protein|nr:DUF2177 family protein [Desulfobacterales bacterium]
MPFWVVSAVYAVMLAVFLAVDLVWLGVAARGFYQRHLGRFFAAKVNWPAAFVFYFLFVAGMLIFAVEPAVAVQSPLRAAVLGALYGLFTYATYDLTNLATLKDWPMPVVVVDIMWGVVLSGLVSVAGYTAATWIR